MQTTHQFADDTSIFLDGSENSLRNTLHELQWFGKISGLNINFSKSHIIWIGSRKYSKDKFLICERLSWNKTKFDLLGLEFDVNLNNMIDDNYNKKLKEIKSTITQWKTFSISPIGRKTLIKYIMLPKLVYLFTALPNPSENFFKTLNTILYNFIWDSPVDRIKRDTLTKTYSEGGLKMINVKAFASSLKLTWLRRLIRDNKKWQHIIMSEICTNEKNIASFIRI